MTEERQHSNLTALCDLVRPWVRDNPQLLRALRETLETWEHEEELCPRCGAAMSATHHHLCQYEDGTPVPLPDEIVRWCIETEGQLTKELRAERDEALLKSAGWITLNESNDLPDPF